jgi:hypothetical protein
MGFFLLWIESLAAVLLLTAAGVAVVARRRRRWPIVLVVLPALAAVAYLAAGAWVIHTSRNAGSVAEALKVGGAAWALLVAVGTLAIAILGVRAAGEPPQPRASRWAAVRLALSGVAAVVLFSATLWTMTNALMARVAALRAEAGTLALAVPSNRVPDHQNAARLYEAAAELLRDSADDQAKRERWADADQLDPNDADLQAYLGRRAAGLNLARRAATLQDCQFDYSQADPLGPLAGAGHVRTAAAVVALQARLSGAQGGTEEAIEDVNRVMRMARHVAANPNTNAILAAAAIEASAVHTLDRVLARAAIPAVGRVPALTDVLNHFLRLALGPGPVEPVHFVADLRRALRAEEALVYGRLAGIVEQAPGFGLVMLDDDLAAFHALFRLMGEALARPYPACLLDWDRIEAQFEHIPGALYRLATPAYLHLLPAVARADASRRVAQFAVAVTSYRANEGKFPARAEDVVPKYLPQVPPDPFTGEPLKLKVTADGVVVYSVGPDGVDDGGQPLSDERPYKGDIRVRIGERK